MRATRVVFPSKGRVELETVELPPLRPGEVALRAICSVISPGTELAWLHAAPGTGGAFPQLSGYCACGTVIARGGEVTSLREGDAVVLDQPHASVMVCAADAETVAPAPRGVPPAEAAAYRLVTIALQGVRKAEVQLGASVLVIGLGVIGNLAGQLARAAGATFVAGADPVAWRGELARSSGFDAAAASADALLRDEATPGHVRERGFEVVIEATGVPEAINAALAAAAPRGRVVLLGSTRGRTADVDFYRDVHRKGLTIVGAHASIRAGAEDVGPLRSLRTDTRTSLEVMASSRVRVGPLISEVLPAREAPAAYERLASRNERLMTIALDWRDAAPPGEA